MQPLLHILIVDPGDSLAGRVRTVAVDTEQYLLEQLDPEDACDLIKSGGCDLVLVAQSQHDHFGISFIRGCNSGHTNPIPMIYCIESIEKMEIEEALAAGASEILRLPELDMIRFGSAVNMAIEAAQKRVSMNRMLRTIIDLVPSMIYAKDREGTILLANEATARFYGTTVNALTGSNQRQWHSDQDEYAQFQKEDMDVIDHGMMLENIQDQMTTADGQHHIIETTKVPLVIADNQLRAVLGISRDVTEKRRLQNVQTRLLAALDAAGDAIVMTGLDGTIEYVNAAFESMTGYSADEAIGNNPRMLKSGKHDPEFYADMWATLLAGRRFQGILTNRRKSGEFIEVEETISPIYDEGQLIAFVAVERDVTEKRLAERALATSEERFSLAAEGSSDGLWDWEIESDQLYLSPRIYAMIGRAAESQPVVNMGAFTDMLAAGEQEVFLKRLKRHMRGLTSQFSHEFPLTHADGTTVWLHIHGICKKTDTGTVSRMAGSLSDISDFKRNEQDLIEQSLRDPLTGLANRKMFINYLTSAINTTEVKNSYCAAVLYITIKRFKELRSSLGDSNSERLIAKVARRIRECTRPSDVMAHVHTAEFALLLPQAGGVEAAQLMATRIEKALLEPFMEDKRHYKMAASIGITMVDKDSNRIAEYVLRDAALAQSVAARRAKTYQLFDQQMYEDAVNRIQIENELDMALEEGQFQLYLQPIIDLQEDQLSGFEALIRWIHPERGLVPPDQFIPIAEETGQIVGIGKWILQEAYRKLVYWHEMGAPYHSLYISVNLSSLELQDESTLALINRLMLQAPFDHSQFRIEITESAILDDAEQTRRVLDSFKELGIDLYLDDFGTGYSSLSYLHSFPFDVLKVDQSFIRDIEKDVVKRRIVESIIQLATHLKMRVVAEGVETETHMNLLKGMGCHKAQGYFFSRPLSPADLPTYLKGQFGEA